MDIQIKNIFNVNLVDRSTSMKIIEQHFKQNEPKFDDLDPTYKAIANALFQRATDGLEFTWWRDPIVAFLNVFIETGHYEKATLVKRNGTQQWLLRVPHDLSNIDELAEVIVKEIVAECQQWIKHNAPVAVIDIG